MDCICGVWLQINKHINPHTHTWISIHMCDIFPLSLQASIVYKWTGHDRWFTLGLQLAHKQLKWSMIFSSLWVLIWFDPNTSYKRVTFHCLFKMSSKHHHTHQTHVGWPNLGLTPLDVQDMLCHHSVYCYLAYSTILMSIYCECCAYSRIITTLQYCNRRS